MQFVNIKNLIAEFEFVKKKEKETDASSSKNQMICQAFKNKWHIKNDIVSITVIDVCKISFKAQEKINLYKKIR